MKRIVSHAATPGVPATSRDCAWGPRVACALMVGAAVFCAGGLQAQTVAPRAQVWVAVGPATRGDAIVHVDAEPPLLLGFLAEARLTADIPVPRTTSRAIEVGASWFPTRHVGLEAWLATDRDTARLTGGLYRTSLEYVASFPPGSVPRDVRIVRDSPLPAMEASIGRWALGLNGAVRWAGAGRIAASLSAGVCRIRASGEAAPLPLVSFWAGGHEVVFSEEYGVVSTLGPAVGWRPNAGGTIDVGLTRHLALSTRVRMVWGGALMVPVRATRTTEPGGMRPADADVAQAMAGSMARVPAAATRLSVGLTLRI